MALISIDSLEIENFGPYYGPHSFNFAPVEERSAVLIGGKMGAGKTHLLRALYLATVGESGEFDLKKLDEGSDATKFLLRESLNRRARTEGCDTTRLSVTISQADAAGTGTRKLKLIRDIRFRAGGTIDFRSVARLSDQQADIEDEAKITKLRDAYLPRHLARFFFFDAERGQSMQLNQQEIVEGISRVLGLWTYGELEGDLRGLVTNKIPKLFGAGSEAEKKLNALNAEIQRVEQDVKALRAEKDELEIQISDIEASMRQIDDDLKTIGAIDPVELVKLDKRREELTREEGELLGMLKKAWDTALPIALLGNFRQKLAQYLVKEEERRGWEGRKHDVEPRIPVVRGQVFDDPPNEHALTTSTRNFYTERLELALKKLFDPPPVGMSDRVFVTDRTDLSAQIRGRLGAPTGQIISLADTVARHDRGQAELRELNQRLIQLRGDRDAQERGNTLRERRGKLVAELEAAQRRGRDVIAEIQQLETKLSADRAEWSKQQAVVDKLNKGRTIASRAQRYLKAVGQIREQAAIQLREQISDVVGELWIEIAERGLEFRSMEFDPRWQCNLVRRSGNVVPWEQVNTSAGQKQVRILAFTEALRRLARLAPPLVVDTPLGRLDKEVRSAVLEKLYLQGHQSIILATNSEIDPESDQFSRIKDRLARVYTLHPHGNPDSEDYEVRVSADYFGKSL
jgi:energy-coupling factor transporter ATP-binding protein EcfA2